MIFLTKIVQPPKELTVSDEKEPGFCMSEFWICLSVTVVRSDQSQLDQAKTPVHFLFAFPQNEGFPFVPAHAFGLCLLEEKQKGGENPMWNYCNVSETAMQTNWLLCVLFMLHLILR